MVAKTEPRASDPYWNGKSPVLREKVHEQRTHAVMSSEKTAELFEVLNRSICLENIQDLIDAGADVNGKNHHCKMPLHLVQDAAVAKILLANGAKINAQIIICGNTPLHTILIQNPSSQILEMAQTFIRYGANINAKNSKGYTPLHYAVMHRHLNVLKLLIQEGADLNSRDNQGNTALHLAYQTLPSFDEAVECLRQAEANRPLA
jgi:ankyrin repeat protein